MSHQGKIEITNEMLEAFKAGFYAPDTDDTSRGYCDERGIRAVIAVIERDYTVTRTGIPDDVNEVKDKDGDGWHRLADGRWVMQGYAILSVMALQDEYGPVTW